MKPKFYTCRFIVRPEETNLSKRMCLAPTQDGLHCKDHVHARAKRVETGMEAFEAFLAKPIIKVGAAKDDLFSEDAIKARRARGRIWP